MVSTPMLKMVSAKVRHKIPLLVKSSSPTSKFSAFNLGVPTFCIQNQPKESTRAVWYYYNKATSPPQALGSVLCSLACFHWQNWVASKAIVFTAGGIFFEFVALSVSTPGDVILFLTLHCCSPPENVSLTAASRHDNGLPLARFFNCVSYEWTGCCWTRHGTLRRMVV
jgi:hypothetical protein